MSRAVFSFEGTVSGEQGGVIPESTPETSINAIASEFEIETASIFIGGGSKGVLQRIYIEAQTENTVCTPSIIVDGTVTALATFSSAPNVKQQFEYAINRVGFIFAIRINVPANTIASRIEISAIEADCYVP